MKKTSKVESQVLELIEQKLRLDDKVVYTIAQQLCAGCTPDDTELKAVQQKINNLLSYIETCGFNQQYADRLKELTEKEKLLKEEYDRACMEPVTNDEIISYIKSIQLLHNSSWEEQKDIINRCVEKIKITESGSVQVTFRLPRVAGERNTSYQLFVIRN